MLLTKIFEKYSLSLILLFVAGVFTPNLTAKIQMMDLNFDAGVTTRSGSNLIKQIFWVFLFVSYISLFFIHRKNIALKLHLYYVRKFILFLSFVSFLFIMSSVWSEYPSYTFKRALFQLILVFCIFGSVSFAVLHDKIAKNLTIFLVFLLIMVVITLLLNVGINSYGQLVGHLDTKNELGMLLASTIVLYTIFCKFQRRESYIVVIMLTLALFSTVSKTSIALIILFFFLRRLPLKLLKSIFLFVFYLSVFLMVILPLINFAFFTNEEIIDIWNISNVVGPDFMTGRGFIWDTLYYQLVYFDKIITGFGFGAVFGVPEIPYFFDVKYSFLNYINSAHNGYIELFIQLGLFSIIAFVAISKTFQLTKNKDIYSFAIFATIHNLSESSFFRDQAILWVYLLIAIVYVLLREAGCSNYKVKHLST